MEKHTYEGVKFFQEPQITYIQIEFLWWILISRSWENKSSYIRNTQSLEL